MFNEDTLISMQKLNKNYQCEETFHINQISLENTILNILQLKILKLFMIKI